MTANDGLAALDVWQRNTPELVLLDLNLPKLDGLEVCRRIRAQDDTPIIMLSVRGGDEAIVAGLELGADDYMVKPFSPSQLVARVRALLRRAGAPPTPGLLEAPGLMLDRSRNELRQETGDPIRLTPLEVRLMEALMLNAGHVLTADQLINTVWGVEGGDRTALKQLVYRLRTKLEPETGGPARIETIPGIGYALAGPPN